MEWFILSRDMHVLCAPSTDSPNSLPIFDDKQTILLSNNTVVSTYDFSVQQKHPDAQNLQMGNYIVFVDKYHKTKMYTLMSHDGDDITHTWHAEDVGLDLLNESSEKWDYTGQPHDIAWYLDNLVLKDSGWIIGINEASTLTRALKFDGETDTQLRRLGDIANQFDGAEVDFTIEMNGAQVTKQVVNIYKKVGSAVTQGRYIDSVNLKSLHSSGSIGDLITAVKPFGAQMDMPEGQEGEAPRINIADVTYDDGRYYSPKGHLYLYDREARQQWSRFRAYNYANQGEFDGYIVGSYTYDTKDPNELLKRALTELKSRNKPSETYEANLLDINADIGDYVQIAHNQYNPPIYLSARVESVTNCYTANGQDTGVLGDYRKLESDIDPRIKEMIDQLADQIKPNYTWIRYAKDDKGTGMTATPTPDTKYVAIVSNKPTGVPSDDPADYAGHWQLIKGEGPEGMPGPKGDDGKTSYTHFAYANNVSGTKDFSTSDPTGRSYMGVYSDFTKADSNKPSDYVWSLTKGETGPEGMQGAQGPKGDIGIPGQKGADGKTSYTHVAYADNDKGGGFSQNPANKAYMGWYSDFTANDSTDPTKYAWSLIKGKDGSTGAPGKPGADGKTPYFHQAWADSKDGKVNFSTTDPTNRGYLGTYSDFTQADSNDPSKYFWTELVGALTIGARNYLADTSTPWQAKGSGGTNQSSSMKWLFTFGTIKQAPFKDGDYVTVSFDYTSVGTGAYGTILPQFNNTPWGQFNGGDAMKDNGHVVRTVQWKSGWTTSGTANGIQIRMDNVATTRTVTVYNMQFERGNKDTDWKQAPEDTQAIIDSLQTPNLVYNAGLQGTYKNGLDGWAFGSAIPDKWYKTSQPSSMIGGVNALAINGSIPANANAIADSKPMTVQAGNVVSAGISMKIGTDSGSSIYTAAEIHFTNNSGVQVGSNVQIGSVNSKTDYASFEKVNVSVPTGATHVGIRCYAHNSSSTSAATVHVFWCKPIINYGAKLAAYTDNQGSGADITQVNEALAKVNKEIAAVPKVTTSKTAPTSPNKGDQWWVQDVNGEINAFKQWDGSKWASSTITQSLLIIKTLDAVNINGSVINGSKFTNNFDYTDLNKVNFKGVTEIANGSYKTDFKIAISNQVGHVYVQPDGFHTYLSGRNGDVNTRQSIDLAFDAISLANGPTFGTLTAADIESTGREVWITSDGVNKPEVGFHKQFRQVWLDGLIALNAASAAKPQFLFKLKNSKLYPKASRYISLISLRDIPDTAILRIDPDGSISNISCRVSNMRFVSEGVFYTIGD